MKETENRIFFNFTQNSFGNKYEMLKLFSLQGVRFLLGHSLALSTELRVDKAARFLISKISLAQRRQ